MRTIHAWPRRLEDFLLAHPLYKPPGLQPADSPRPSQDAAAGSCSVDAGLAACQGVLALLGHVFGHDAAEWRPLPAS